MLVSLSSVVTECFEDVSLDSDWEFVEPQSSSFSKKRSIVWEENHEEMSYEGMPVKAPPKTRRRMMPPTPPQSSHSSTEERHGEELELRMDPEDSEVNLSTSGRRQAGGAAADSNIFSTSASDHMVASRNR